MFAALAAESRDSLQMIDSTIVKAHRAAAGAKGGSAIRRSASAAVGARRKIHALVDCKGRPLHFVVTGGQVHDYQVVGELLQVAQPPLAVTADKAYDSKTARQQIRDEGAVPVIPSCSTAVRKARWASTDSATRSKTSSVASGIGGDSPPPSTNSPAISSPPLASSRPLLGHVMSPDPSHLELKFIAL